MKPVGLLAVALIIFQLCGCSLASEPQLVYQADEPDLNTPSSDPLPELGEGDDAIVTLANGERFEAKYRGVSDGALEFEDVEWDEVLAREPEPTLSCSLDEVSEIRRGDDWGTADTIVAVSSIAALVVMLSIYGHGDG